METSRALATDSFSYSWLINGRKPSFDGLVEALRLSLDRSCEASFREVMHGDQQKNKFLKEDQDFDFNIDPDSSSSVDFVHADEIFSDGCLMPVYVNRSKMQASTSVPASPISTLSSLTVCSAYGSQCYFLRKWTKSSNKVLQKCFAFLRRIRCSRKCIRVDDLDRKVREVRSWSNSLQASPDPKTAYSSVSGAYVRQINNKGDAYKGHRHVKSWSSSPQASPPRSPSHSTVASSYDTESSIREAILHCKRSFAK